MILRSMIVEFNERGSERKANVLAALLTLIPALGYALYTEDAWEDFFIAFRHSANLARHGELTYQLGERIQGFSSPFAVLLGALAYRVTGAGPVAPALWLLRGTALLFVLLTALQLQRYARYVGASALGAGLLLLLFAIESKSVAFAMNGMETPFFVFFVFSSFVALAGETPPRPRTLGLLWAGALWCRPDGVVFIGLLGLAHLIFGPARAGQRFARLLRAASVCALAYLPWLLFAWLYYGTPIPQTITAKVHLGGGFGVGVLLDKLWEFPWVAALVFQPSYAQYDPWPWLAPGAMAFGVVVCALWLLPVRPTARMASFSVAGAVLYLTLIGEQFPWYLPPVFVLSLPVILEAGTRLGALIARRWRAGEALGHAPGLALGLALGLAFLIFTSDRAAIYGVLDRDHRRQIGLWLRERAEPEHRVFLECPGFIGFHSGLPVLDYPGLVAPAVSALLARNGPQMHGAGWALQPEWMVLRPGEYDGFESALGPRFRQRYDLVEIFDARQTFLARQPWHRTALHDAVFLILKRKDVTIRRHSGAPEP